VSKSSGNSSISVQAASRQEPIEAMGATHFLTKKLPRVRTEMSLHVVAAQRALVSPLACRVCRRAKNASKISSRSVRVTCNAICDCMRLQSRCRENLNFIPFGWE
jgi:hypothetical protein